MRVVHVIDSGGYYGAEVMLVHLCQAQIELGLDVEVISIGTPGNYEKPLEKKLRENAIPFKVWRMMALPDFRESLEIIKYCKETSTDVIHSHGYKGNILLGLIPRRWRKMPVVATLHGYTQPKRFSKMAFNQWLDRFCLNRLDAVVLVSEGMRHQAPARLAPRLHTIANGIPESVPPGASQMIEYFSAETFNIGAIGRLSYEKNFQLLIGSMPAVLQAKPNARLVIFGEGIERPKLEALVTELSLNDFVFLPGYIEEPARLFQHADVFVNCSLTEGMPITLLEALRAGCPIVASDIPANRTLLSKVNRGAKLVSLSTQAFAESILSVSTIPIEQLEEAKAEAIHQFKKSYTAAEMARKYHSIYSSCRQSDAHS